MMADHKSLHEVANSGDQGTSGGVRRRRRGREVKLHEGRNNNDLETSVSSMFISGFDPEKENSAILSALTRAVAGAGDHQAMEAADGDSDELDGESTAFPVFIHDSSPPSLWGGVGEKRGRDNNNNIDDEYSPVEVLRAYNDLSSVDSVLGSSGGESSLIRTNSTATGGGANNNITDSSNSGGGPKRRNRGVISGTFDTLEAAADGAYYEATLKSRGNSLPENATFLPSFLSNSSSLPSKFLNNSRPSQNPISSVVPLIHPQNLEYPTNSSNYTDVSSYDHLTYMNSDKYLVTQHPTSLLNQELSSMPSQMDSCFQTDFSTPAFPCPDSSVFPSFTEPTLPCFDSNEYLASQHPYNSFNNSTSTFPYPDSCVFPSFTEPISSTQNPEIFTDSVNHPNASLDHFPYFDSNECLARQHPNNSFNNPYQNAPDHLPYLNSNSNLPTQDPTNSVNYLNTSLDQLLYMNSDETLTTQNPINASSNRLISMNSNENFARSYPTSLLDQVRFQANSFSSRLPCPVSQPALPSRQMPYYDDDPVVSHTFMHTADAGFPSNFWSDLGI
ncbi:OLC1v1008892C1 [Oldenlandia corymbosa var. corymbosa]|uniref:OLC1v1008892C1 n=1 Tax=Oldenlandia corymbosa var. corymbosa TaxID=529605 RepID=A0AAV1DMS5_OLDCO|nr:OLC1v1008892C1 [Oldenlandia corymbosa var. corymbosa]